MKPNAHITAMRCIRCGAMHPFADYFEGCPICLVSGAPASVAPHFDRFPDRVTRSSWNEWLSYPERSGLGEGNTPLSDLSPLASELGLESVLTKNEFLNPAGSHKDRMAAVVVQRARHAGVDTLAVASSGNAGVSTAAYAARVGMNCVVVTTPAISANWRRPLEMHGATILATSKSNDRWKLVQFKARSGEWYPVTNYLTPPVGSNPFGVDGYRGIAFELFLDLGEGGVTDIVVPTSRGDLIWGIAKGFIDLRSAGIISILPRIHAVEPLPRIERAQSGHGMVGEYPPCDVMVSIGGDTTTYQSLNALEMTGGMAISVSDDAAIADQSVLAQCGLYLESSSAATLSGLRKLITSGIVSKRARVVLLATSHGYKEQAQFRDLRPINIEKFS